MRNRYVLVADLFAIALCLLGAFVLRLDWFFTQSADLTRAFAYAVVAGVLAKPAVFHAFGLYRRYWRYAGLSDLLVVVTAVSAASAILALARGARRHGRHRAVLPAIGPRHRLAPDAGLRRRGPPVACGSSRKAWRPGPARRRPGVAPRPDRRRRRRRRARRARDRRRTRSSACTRSATSTIIRPSSASGSTACRCVGAARRPRGRGGALRRRRGRSSRCRPRRARSSASVLEACARAGVRHGRCRACSSCSTAASASTGCARSTSRPAAPRPDQPAARRRACTCRARSVLVTGAGGSIGSRALPPGRARAGGAAHPARPRREQHLRHRQPAARGRIRRCRSARSIADIRDADRLRAIFAAERPAIVFHAAAHKHVPLMEEHPEEAVTNNVRRHADAGRRRARRRRRALRPDLDRQGGGADQHHGRDQAHGRGHRPRRRSRSTDGPSSRCASATCSAAAAAWCRSSSSRSSAAGRSRSRTPT